MRRPGTGPDHRCWRKVAKLEQAQAEIERALGGFNIHQRILVMRTLERLVFEARL
jgi:hypothetical protein